MYVSSRTERFLITVVVWVGGIVLLSTSPHNDPLVPWVTGMLGAVIGWWAPSLPQQNGDSKPDGTAPARIRNAA